MKTPSQGKTAHTTAIPKQLNPGTANDDANSIPEPWRHFIDLVARQLVTAWAADQEGKKSEAHPK